MPIVAQTYCLPGEQIDAAVFALETTNELKDPDRLTHFVNPDVLNPYKRVMKSIYRQAPEGRIWEQDAYYDLRLGHFSRLILKRSITYTFDHDDEVIELMVYHDELQAMASAREQSILKLLGRQSGHYRAADRTGLRKAAEMEFSHYTVALYGLHQTLWGTSPGVRPRSLSQDPTT